MANHNQGRRAPPGAPPPAPWHPSQLDVIPVLRPPPLPPPAPVPPPPPIADNPVSTALDAGAPQVVSQSRRKIPNGLPHASAAHANPKQQHAAKQGRGGVPATLLLGSVVLLLMVAGMAGTDRRLLASRQASQAGSATRLSAASFAQQQEHAGISSVPGEGRSAGDSSSATSLAALLTSAATVVAEQLTGASTHLQVQQQPTPLTEQEAEPLVPMPKWQLRCAVLNNLVFHVDVMAGWTYAFQTAGCDVTVYQNERSLGIEDIMSSWLTGRFRKPELFPGEAGDYHIVILPTFRDQHAEMVQYLLQLPRLKHQRYFLTQHNPDWLLNHPNVDILQQQLLNPLLDAARQQDAQQQQQQAGRNEQPLDLRKQPLRIQLATLAPCVSNYTLHFLREMAFNLTEGYTYEERVGSFKVRSDVAQGVSGDGISSKDNAEEIRHWISSAINIDVPWMSPLVPWQPLTLAAAPAPAPAEAMPQLQAAAPGPLAVAAASPAPAEGGHAATVRQLLALAKKNNKKGKQDKQGRDSNKKLTLAPAPPPPPPLGAEAIALLNELNLLGGSTTSRRHVCIQGKLENSRRNYTAAFGAISHPAVLSHLRTQRERLLLLGHRSKWENVTIPDSVADVVVVLESLPYQLYFDTLSRCRAILLAFSNEEYYTKKSSSTIATAINVGVPLVAERRTLAAYTFLQPEACFVYDEQVASDWGTSSAGERKQQKSRRQLQGVGGDKDAAAAGSSGGRSSNREQTEGQKAIQSVVREAAKQPSPTPGSYSAAILSALRAENSLAAHEAVKHMKAEVMNHNVMVAAAFMAGTQGQYSAEEQAADAAWWQQRLKERQERHLQEEVVWAA